jgi:hypothetical protein
VHPDKERHSKRRLSVSATAAYVFHCGVRSRIFCAERVNDFPLRRRRFGRCGFTWGNGRRHFVVASKPRASLWYRLALRRLCDRICRKDTQQKQRNNSHFSNSYAMNRFDDNTVSQRCGALLIDCETSIPTEGLARQSRGAFGSWQRARKAKQPIASQIDRASTSLADTFYLCIDFWIFSSNFRVARH